MTGKSIHNVSRLMLAALCLAHGAPNRAQVVSINEEWGFQRLDSVAVETVIKNQGGDWESQYNIQHLETQGELTVPAHTLSLEKTRLEAGGWERVTLPHTPLVEPLVVRQQWQGVCYYRRKLPLAPKDMGKRFWLEFEGAMHLADLWVNGVHAAQHAGGYTPFVTDITNLVRSGENELLIRLDNRNNPLVPPGKPLEELDFCYYGGLYRDARVIMKNPVHITNPILAGEVAGGGIFVTYPTVTPATATVSVKTHIANELAEKKSLMVKQQLFEWQKDGKLKKKVAEATQPLAIGGKSKAYVSHLLTVDAPRLWCPESPALYVLQTEVMDGKTVVDRELTRIGIREIKMTYDDGLTINGKPYRLEGTNRHQEYPYVGNAIPDQAQYRDIWQIRNNGFNVVRLGHYPQDPSVLDACDELGLLAIEPIPGWQFFNSAEGFVKRTYQDVRDLIRRDRNHPCIIMWETTLNESNPPAYWKDGAVKTAHEEQPGNQCYTSGDTYGYDGFDVCYNDWAGHFNRPNRVSKPAFIREYYDYEFGGHYSTTRITRGEGDRALVQNAWNAQWSHNRYRTYYPHTMGQAVWSMYDYNRGCCDNICYSGTADVFRLPKFSLSYFRTQQAAGTPLPEGKMPYEIFINSHWMRGSSDTLQVYGNVDEVALLLNGHEVARQAADRRTPGTDYVDRPDGGNAGNIDFPPFTFFGLKWQEGELTAVGYKNGEAVARHTVRTPGEAADADITYFRSGVEASRQDLLIVYVTLKDQNGTECFGENGREVSLKVVQGGELRSPATVRAEAGVASFLVATGKGRTLKLKATSGALTCEKNIKLKPWKGYSR